MQDLLLDSWVSDGQIGFYVDDAWSKARSPFSLYDTYWNLRLAEWDPGRSAGIEKHRVALWLRNALKGDHNVDSLSKITQLHYAVQVSSLLGLSLDKQQVNQTLEQLRFGGNYRSNPQEAPSWGETALAIEALALANLPVPKPVRSAIARAAVKQPAKLSLKNVVSDLVPILRAIGALNGAGLPRSLVARQVARALAVLDSAAADPLSLGPRTVLSRLARQFKVPVNSIAMTPCMPLGSHGLDLQLVYYAKQTGCLRDALPPAGPRSRAGWPTPRAISNSLRSTVAGLHLARAIGIQAGESKTKIQNMLRNVWMPEYEAAGDAASLVLAARIQMVARSLGQEGMPGATSPDDSSDLSRMLSLYSISKSNGAAARRIIPQRPKSMLDAATLELASRILGDAHLHEMATRVSNSLKLANDAHVLESEQTLPSMTATAIAAWITESAIPRDAWVRWGMCEGHRCAESSAELPNVESTSLRVLALTQACLIRGCGSELPPVI